jgi:hypothetical protein
MGEAGQTAPTWGQRDAPTSARTALPSQMPPSTKGVDTASDRSSRQSSEDANEIDKAHDAMEMGSPLTRSPGLSMARASAPREAASSELSSVPSSSQGQGGQVCR